MKLKRLALLAALSGGLFGATAGTDSVAAQDLSSTDVSQVSILGADMIGCDSGCDSGLSMGCDSRGHSACPLGLGGLLDFGDCDLGEPLSLLGSVGNYSAGGWVQMGYHSASNGLFNSRPHDYQLHQAWLYAERAIDTSDGFDIGGRIDYVYGTDGPDTQAFGTGQRGWDNSWDNGGDYGHALPQAYLEAGYGDWSVKVGHFFTTIGFEVVAAPDNFFYSHAYTMYNSEPFTHTGALVNWDMSDDLSVYGGYTLGWDSGFDDNGDAFLGGFSAQMTDTWSLAYSATIGRFGENRLGSDERGFMHSIVSTHQLTDRLTYVSQSDYLNTEDASGANVRDTYGLNNYLFHRLNDCNQIGARFEWWNNELGNAGDDSDVYALTLGWNHKPHSNVIIRPEIRWDWDSGQTVNLNNANEQQLTTFGIDTVVLF